MKMVLPGVLVSLLAACGGSSEDVRANSMTGMREVAAAIYDAADADADADVLQSELPERIHAVMLAFGVAVESDLEVLEPLYAEREPIFLEPQTYDLAAAFLDGGYVPLDDFITSAAAAGATRQDGGALDRGYLDAQFGELAGKAEFTAAEALPAFVLALAAERAARHGGDDPLWGDGLLDPLQTTLLLYAVTRSAGAEAAAPAARRAAPSSPSRPKFWGRDVTGIIFDFTIDRIIGQLEGRVVEWIEWPTGPDDLVQSSLCVSLLLYGHKLTVSAAPSIIYHQQVDNAAPPPFATTVQAELIFMDDYYWNNYGVRADIARLGCTLPRQGTVPSAPIAWGTSETLVDHGSYNLYPPTTDGDGKSTGHWSTVAETTPASKRTPANQKSADGWVLVKATSLVPGWNALARAVSLGDDAGKTGNVGMSELSVLYYEDPCAAGALWAGGGQCVDSWTGTAESTFTVPDGGYHITADVTWTPVLSDASGTIYEASGTVTYEMFETGCTVTVDPPMATIDSATGSSDLHILYGDDPVTYTGSGGMFWGATVTRDCPPDEPIVAPGQYIGGQYFRAADPTEMTSSTVLSDNYTFMDAYQYQWSFQRGGR